MMCCASPEISAKRKPLKDPVIDPYGRSDPPVPCTRCTSAPSPFCTWPHDGTTKPVAGVYFYIECLLTYRLVQHLQDDVTRSRCNVLERLIDEGIAEMISVSSTSFQYKNDSLSQANSDCFVVAETNEESESTVLDSLPGVWHFQHQLTVLVLRWVRLRRWQPLLQ